MPSGKLRSKAYFTYITKLSGKLFKFLASFKPWTSCEISSYCSDLMKEAHLYWYITKKPCQSTFSINYNRLYLIAQGLKSVSCALVLLNALMCYLRPVDVHPLVRVTHDQITTRTPKEHAVHHGYHLARIYGRRVWFICPEFLANPVNTTTVFCCQMLDCVAVENKVMPER